MNLISTIFLYKQESELPEKRPFVGVCIEISNLKMEDVIKGRVRECLGLESP